MSIWKFLEKEAGKGPWNKYFDSHYNLELFTKLGFKIRTEFLENWSIPRREGVFSNESIVNSVG